MCSRHTNEIREVLGMFRSSNRNEPVTWILAKHVKISKATTKIHSKLGTFEAEHGTLRTRVLLLDETSCTSSIHLILSLDPREELAQRTISSEAPFRIELRFDSTAQCWQRNIFTRISDSRLP